MWCVNILNMSRKARIRVFIFLFSFILSLLLGEVLLRMSKKPINEIESVYTYTQLNINYGLEFMSNIDYEEYGYGGKVNSYGFYSPPISIEKKGKRIAYIGDSYSIAPALSSEDNFPYKVSKRLIDENRISDYLVAAIPGTSPLQNKFIFKNKVSRFNPDIVVYQAFDNDISDDYVFAYSQYHARIKVWNSVPTFLRESMIVQQIMIITTERLTKAYDSFYKETKEIIDDNPEKVWEEYTKPSLDEILSLARKNGAKLVLLYIPTGKVFVNEYIGKPLEERYILNTLLKQWTKENKVSLVDMYDNFLKRNTEEFNEIYLPEEKGFHLTKEGADMVSERLYNLLKNQIF